jgi:hypothetical protein
MELLEFRKKHGQPGRDWALGIVLDPESTDQFAQEMNELASVIGDWVAKRGDSGTLIELTFVGEDADQDSFETTLEGLIAGDLAGLLVGRPMEVTAMYPDGTVARQGTLGG